MKCKQIPQQLMRWWDTSQCIWCEWVSEWFILYTQLFDYWQMCFQVWWLGGAISHYVCDSEWKELGPLGTELSTHVQESTHGVGQRSMSFHRRWGCLVGNHICHENRIHQPEERYIKCKWIQRQSNKPGTRHLKEQMTFETSGHESYTIPRMPTSVMFSMWLLVLDQCL